MPCRNDYMDPNQKERDIVETCRHIVFLNEQLGFDTEPEIKEVAMSTYGNNIELEKIVPRLCEMLTNLSEADEDEYVYDGRKPQARKLAEWWDRHQEADRLRKEKENQVKIEAGREEARKAFNSSILSKLDPTEIGYLKSLGVNFND